MAKKNYTKYSNKEVKIEPVTEQPMEVVTEETPGETPAKIGVVTGCVKLNVRKKPDVKADVVCEIVCLSEVVVDEEASTSEFYKVYTVSGVDGFCMKKFITIKE